MGGTSPELCAKQGPLPSQEGSWGSGCWFVSVFCLSKKAELLGEQKGALALALEVSALRVREDMQICAGERPLCFLGVGVFFLF